MDEVDWWLFALLLFFIALGGFFAGAEISLASVNQSRIKIRSDKGEKRASKTLYLLRHFDQTLSTILIGNNISHVFSASLAALLVTKIWGTGALVYSTISITIIVFLISEMLPKTLAKAYSETASLWVSPLLYYLTIIFRPISALLTGLGNIISKLFDDESRATVTEEEFYNIIETIKNENALEDQKGQWIHTALNFGDKSVENVLTVRTDIVAVDIMDDPAEVYETIKETKHSRIPIYKDNIDNIIGILLTRRYLRASYQLGKAADIMEYIDPPLFVFSSTDIDELLPEMSRKKVNLAIVTNTFGGVVGLVTVEDILEELVGEIWDEDDIAIEYFYKLRKSCYEVDASVSVGEVFEKLNLDDHELDDLAHESMGSWVYESFGRIPSIGDKIESQGLCIEVSQMDKRRIMKLIVSLPSEKKEEALCK